MSVDISTLVIGKRLGDGGQAEVFAVDNLPGLAFKRYRPSVLRELRPDVLEELAAEAAHLKLEGQPIAHWAAWPTETVTERSRVIGFLMPLLGDEFLFATGNLRGKLATFGFLAASKPAPFWGEVTLPDQNERVQLLEQLAGILQQLHHRHMVVGDLSWGNVVWSREPVVRVVLIDCDGIRPGTGVPVARQLESPDWTDPQALAGGVPDADRDCYKLALMVLRVLGCDMNARLPHSVGAAPQGLPLEMAAAIDALLVRASGPAGTRPSAKEWRLALQKRTVVEVKRPTPRPLAPPPPQRERQWYAAAEPSSYAHDPASAPPVPPGTSPPDRVRRWTSVDPNDDTP